MVLTITFEQLTYKPAHGINHELWIIKLTIYTHEQANGITATIVHEYTTSIHQRKKKVVIKPYFETKNIIGELLIIKNENRY